MSIGAIVAIVILVLLVAAAAAVVARQMHRRALHDRFGEEYQRLAEEIGPRRAEAELTARQRRVARLNLRPLTAEQRARYAGEWSAVQERFVDDPPGAVTGAAALVVVVQKERGYPDAVNRDEEMANLSVHHADAVTGYRQARQVTDDVSSASTDDLRQAMIQYRTLFRELTGGGVPAARAWSPAEVGPGAPGTPAVPATRADPQVAGAPANATTTE